MIDDNENVIAEVKEQVKCPTLEIKSKSERQFTVDTGGINAEDIQQIYNKFGLQKQKLFKETIETMAKKDNNDIANQKQIKLLKQNNARLQKEKQTLKKKNECLKKQSNILKETMKIILKKCTIKELKNIGAQYQIEFPKKYLKTQMIEDITKAMNEGYESESSETKTNEESENNDTQHNNDYINNNNNNNNNDKNNEKTNKNKRKRIERDEECDETTEHSDNSDNNNNNNIPRKRAKISHLKTSE